jgi:signal transduction histidine kinase
LKLQLDGLIRAFHGDPRMKDRLERAARQAERLARLTDELLDVSRITAGRLELAPKRLELGELVAELLEQHREDASRAGSTLTFERPREEIWVHWDRARLAQAVSGLMENAIRYGLGKPIEVTLAEVEGTVEVAVRDEGVGIESSAHGRIFERFERAAGARGVGGLGLGLYVVRAIARAHGGDVTVSSTQGAGSVFTLRLPRTVEVRRGAQPSSVTL